MTIQFNTDKNINGDERNENYYTSLIEEGVKRYDAHITRIEVHISDENGDKDSLNDKRCLLEARMEGRQPIAVIQQADTMEMAVSGAIDKLSTSLKTITERLSNH